MKTSKYVSFLCLNQFTELAVNQNVFAAGWGRADQIKDGKYLWYYRIYTFNFDFIFKSLSQWFDAS